LASKRSNTAIGYLYYIGVCELKIFEFLNMLILLETTFLGSVKVFVIIVAPSSPANPSIRDDLLRYCLFLRF